MSQPGSMSNTQEPASTWRETTPDTTGDYPANNDNNQHLMENENAIQASETAPAEPTTDTSSNQDNVYSSESTNGSGPTFYSIPTSRTGLIRPSALSSWERPADPAPTVPPGIITAAIFAALAFVGLSLILVRVWRRRRTRRRTRSVMNLIDRARRERGEGPDGEIPEMVPYMFETKPHNDTNIGVQHDEGTPSLASLPTALSAKMRPRSIKGLIKGPFPVDQQGLSPTVFITHSVPHAPTRSSPLRIS
ncbi:hypothetical protein CPB86DRAFT_751622 [Serendipita vermifera]|nr:hypothetical protein CPB86DRAFT_751622 [Serendipita vermifera]